jgi:hypothetical protein
MSVYIPGNIDMDRVYELSRTCENPVEFTNKIKDIIQPLTSTPDGIELSDVKNKIISMYCDENVITSKELSATLLVIMNLYSRLIFPHRPFSRICDLSCECRDEIFLNSFKLAVRKTMTHISNKIQSLRLHTSIGGNEDEKLIGLECGLKELKKLFDD